MDLLGTAGGRHRHLGTWCIGVRIQARTFLDSEIPTWQFRVMRQSRLAAAFFSVHEVPSGKVLRLLLSPSAGALSILPSITGLLYGFAAPSTLKPRTRGI